MKFTHLQTTGIDIFLSGRKLKSIEWKYIIIFQKINLLFSSYVIAYLPQLVYFEYKLITKSIQQKSTQYYAVDIERLEVEEKRIADENRKEENDDKHLSDQKLAFVENLNKSQLFELMQDRDPYSHIMVMMKGDMPSIYERYQQEFNVYTQQLFQMGKIIPLCYYANRFNIFYE